MKNSAKNLLLVFLALVALGGGALAWHQYVELVALRAAALSPADRKAEQARLAAAQRYARELEDQIAAVREQSLAAGDGTAGATARTPANLNEFGRGRGGPANLRSLMENPEVRKLMTRQQQAALDLRYAALFKALSLPAAQLDKFKSLLLEKQTVMQDVMMAAREQGLDPRTDPEGFRKLVSTTQADLDASLKAVLGDPAYTQYEQYQQAQPQRNVLTQLQQSLSYTDAPLSDTQAAQLMQILAATATTPAAGGPPEGGRGGPMGGGGGGVGPAALITTQTIAQAQSVLTATQLQALQQLQQTQQAQQQLEQIMRNSGGGPPAAARTPSGEG